MFQPSSRFRSLLLRCARLMSDEINTILLSSQLNYSLWQVLYTIQSQQQCTLVDISSYLNVSKPSITKRIQHLSELDLICQIETEDKRQKYLNSASKGLKPLTCVLNRLMLLKISYCNRLTQMICKAVKILWFS